MLMVKWRLSNCIVQIRIMRVVKSVLDATLVVVGCIPVYTVIGIALLFVKLIYCYWRMLLMSVCGYIIARYVGKLYVREPEIGNSSGVKYKVIIIKSTRGPEDVKRILVSWSR